MEELQREVEEMKHKQNEKSASYKQVTKFINTLDQKGVWQNEEQI